MESKMVAFRWGCQASTHDHNNTHTKRDRILVRGDRGQKEQVGNH